MSTYVAFFLALVFVLFNVSTDAKHQYSQTTNTKSIINLAFKSLIPPNERYVYFDCKVGTFVLPSQQAHIMVVPIDQVVSCHAYWKQSEAIITAFDPKSKIIGHDVFWLIRPDGLLQTLDNFSFEKKATLKPRRQK
ncbi:leguminosin group486 secreted peptide [Medicago truncatula]|uniref:Leguminosin group486 secreted peptide n=1 Tax=Medicago truncatula TaxID=3880 RepID=A0A072THN5_MEDTR|nr:leguminosin group486 secreted peptide [Medicago truncatula]